MEQSGKEDDSLYTKSDRDPAVVQAAITVKYKQIYNYMSKNKLVLNNEKTHLIIMASKNQNRSHGNFDIRLDTGGDDMIEPIACEKLLGGYISNNFKWNDQIKGKDGSIFKSVVSRINALKQISSFSSFKTLKMIANGVMSKFLYLIHT